MIFYIIFILKRPYLAHITLYYKRYISLILYINIWLLKLLTWWYFFLLFIICHLLIIWFLLIIFYMRWCIYNCFHINNIFYYVYIINIINSFMIFHFNYYKNNLQILLSLLFIWIESLYLFSCDYYIFIIVLYFIYNILFI